MSFRVLDPGLQSLVVDFGRPASRGLGVPVGGAADRQSLSLGNALVNNPPDVAALEICLAGPTLKAIDDTGCVLFGAPFEACRGDERIPIGHTLTMRAGEVFRIAGTAVGMRAYLCVHGGFQESAVLGSRSSFEPVRRGQELQCDPSVLPRRFIDVPSGMSDGTVTLRALPGPQADWFKKVEFFGPTFTVSPASNRMGLRLQGARLPLTESELVSEPVAPGAVQVVNDGQCIILGIDGQTIGGYPKVAHVITADLDRLGQLRPGQQVRFDCVTVDQANQAYRTRQSELHEWLVRLR
jgi:biotin-dependent carboxylase-like uncharacterized protein